AGIVELVGMLEPLGVERLAPGGECPPADADPDHAHPSTSPIETRFCQAADNDPISRGGRARQQGEGEPGGPRVGLAFTGRGSGQPQTVTRCHPPGTFSRMMRQLAPLGYWPA